MITPAKILPELPTERA